MLKQSPFIFSLKSCGKADEVVKSGIVLSCVPWELKLPQAEEPGGLHSHSGLHRRGVQDLAAQKGDTRGLGDQVWGLGAKVRKPLSALSKGAVPTICSQYHSPAHPRSTSLLYMCSPVTSEGR